MSIKAIFDEISNESSTNKKMEILKKHKDGPNGKLLGEVLYLALSKRVKFYIKRLPTVTNHTGVMTLEGSMVSLNSLSTRQITGNAALHFLETTLTSLTQDDAYIIERIIEKDVKLGMGRTNINKIYGDLIEKTPYMGAKAFDADEVKELIESGPCVSQVKMDGRYANALIRGGEVDLESRGGEPSYLTGAKFLEEISQFPDCVLNGEFTMDGYTRYESNGIIASLISIGGKIAEGEDATKDIKNLEKDWGLTRQELLNKIKFTVWDRIEVEEYFAKKSDLPYGARLIKVHNLIDEFKPTMTVVIAGETIHSYEQAIAHCVSLMEKGEEGTILKSLNGKWKDGKPKWQFKMKLEMDVDMKVIGFNLGTKGSKNEHLISSLTVSSSDGIVTTRPAGMSEKDMKYVTENREALMGSIVEVKCCGLSKNDKGEYALLHPVFKKFRTGEKENADSFEDIQKIEKMAKSIK
jgi:DNA ligase-1